MAPREKHPGEKPGSICSCQVKPYNINDPSTWERPKYVHLHGAFADCCQPPVYTISSKDLNKSEAGGSQPQGHKRQGSNNLTSNAYMPSNSSFEKASSVVNDQQKQKPIKTSTDSYGKSPSTSFSARPTLVNGRLVPSRLSNMETQVAKATVQATIHEYSDAMLVDPNLEQASNNKPSIEDDDDNFMSSTVGKPTRTYSNSDRRKSTQASKQTAYPSKNKSKTSWEKQAARKFF